MNVIVRINSVSSSRLPVSLGPTVSRVDWVMPIIISVLLIVFFANASSGQKGELSTICKFTAGPRAGQLEDYGAREPAPVGAICHDGAGSTGFVVARHHVELSTICKFTNGPRIGQTVNYAPLAPIPVGSPCHDGQGSTGIVVTASGVSQQPDGAAGPLSNTCKFTAGPRAGQIQSYPKVSPIPVGSPCHDGQGSTGFAIADR